MTTCTCPGLYSDPDCPEHHLPVSVAGWYCDVCGVAVNGQTDEDGRPVMRGDSVRHTP